LLFSFQIKVPESTTTRTAGGLDFAAIGGKRQGREVPHSLKITRWNRGFSCEAPGLENPIASHRISGYEYQLKIKTANLRMDNLKYNVFFSGTQH
jgi:hypothetical protein